LGVPPYRSGDSGTALGKRFVYREGQTSAWDERLMLLASAKQHGILV
jgi:hypothetical protein